MISDGIVGFRSLLPFFARRQRSQRQGDSLNRRNRCFRERTQRAGEYSLHFLGKLLAQAVGHIELRTQHTAAWVCIRSATNRNQSRAAGIAALNMFHCITGPVATDHVVAERHTMARVVCKHRSQLAVFTVYRQHRHIMIDRAVFGTTIKRKTDFAHSP